MKTAHPLDWPLEYPRTSVPKRSKFKTTFGKARDGLLKELSRLGGTEVILSTNIPYRKSDGKPYANYKGLSDHGVAVYFQYLGEQRVLACDKWDRIEDNFYAIQLTIEAMRGMDRWGVTDMLKRMFSGFTALPEHAEEKWYDVLGVSWDATPEEITSAFRTQAKRYHPDKNQGDFQARENFERINRAYTEAKNSF